MNRDSRVWKRQLEEVSSKSCPLPVGNRSSLQTIVVRLKHHMVSIPQSASTRFYQLLSCLFMKIVKIKNQITNVKNHQKASKENIKKLNYSNLSLFLDCLKLGSLVSSPSKVLPFSQFQRQSALYVRHLGRFGTASNRAIIVRVL